MSTIKVLVCSLVVGMAASIMPARAYPDVGIAAITVPSADVTLSFVQPGRIAEIHFKEGDAVKTGDALAQLDDAADQVRLAQLEAESKNRTNILAAVAAFAQKKVDLM